MNAEPFLEYVRLRLEASACRATGGPPPWSDDSVISSRHFCNVIRDDDWTSREARAIIVGLPVNVAWSAAMTFRLYNRPETLEALLTAGVFVGEPASRVEEVLRSFTRVFNTVAYRVTLKGGLWNLPTLSQIIARSGRLASRDWRPRETAEHAVQQLQGELGIGPFLAYQVMQDLRWLRGPYKDEDAWCLFGGGARAGLDHLLGVYSAPKMDAKNRIDHNVSSSLNAGDRETLTPVLTAFKILEARANMFELEHNLCEYRKWKNIHSGEATGRLWKPRSLLRLASGPSLIQGSQPPATPE
jgi:hypothetical protein